MVVEEKFYVAKCDKCGCLFEDSREGVTMWKPTPEEAENDAVEDAEGFSHAFVRGNKNKKFLLCKKCYEEMTDNEGYVLAKYLDDDGNLKAR